MKLQCLSLLLALAVAVKANEETCIQPSCPREILALTALLKSCYHSLENGASEWRNGHNVGCFSTSCESQRLALLDKLTSCQATAPTESDWIYFEKTKAFYKFVKNMNFEEGKRYCAGLGGNLASIHSAEENKFILEAGKHFQKDAVYGIIGLQDRKWIDGTTVDYSNWATSLPDGIGRACTYMLFNPTSGPKNTGKWANSICRPKSDFVVCKVTGRRG